MHALLMPLLLLPSYAWAGFGVSSFKPERQLGANTWNVASALDTNPTTAWHIDPTQDNEGQWITIDVPASTLDKLSIVNGWAKSEETFKDHARIKEARVEVLDISSQPPTTLHEHTVTFEDAMAWQTIDLPDIKVGSEFIGGRVRVTVVSVYPGADYPHLALSEVRVDLKEFPAETLELVLASDSIPGRDAVDLIDKRNATFWASPTATGSFSVQASGYGLAAIHLVSGPATFARPKTIRVTANDTTQEHVLEDKPGAAQRVLLPCLVGYVGGAWGQVDVEIVDVYPGREGNGVAVAEVKLSAATIEEF